MGILKYLLFFGIISCFIFCHKIHQKCCPESVTIPLVVQGDSTSKMKIEEIIKSNPNLNLPQTLQKYSLIIVEPDASINYHILQVKPDSNIDYKMIIINPMGDNVRQELDPELKEAIIESIEKNSRR
jgi:hypothetical protein